MLMGSASNVALGLQWHHAFVPDQAHRISLVVTTPHLYVDRDWLNVCHGCNLGIAAEDRQCMHFASPVNALGGNFKARKVVGRCVEMAEHDHPATTSMEMICR
jgi:hypothetical protein